jgi:hypothetical protein
VIKSAFELSLGAQLTAGTQQLLSGRSWSARAPIRQVELSVDGGSTWQPAKLHGANVPGAWRRWTFTWTPPGPGRYTLQARATDTTGAAQPATVPFNDGGYLFGAIVNHPVTVT